LYGNRLQVLLVHPGGPFWARKDDGVWSIAKGEYADDEAAFDAALREFEEETGHKPNGKFIALTAIRQPSGKVISVWAVEDDWDLSGFHSNSVTMEWPRNSGRLLQFDEVDRVEWLDIKHAARKILPGQLGFLKQLTQQVLGIELSAVTLGTDQTGSS
jgi:predicted NUDIX family NTP pyrophosphohydrolase